MLSFTAHIVTFEDTRIEIHAVAIPIFSGVASRCNQKKRRKKPTGVFIFETKLIIIQDVEYLGDQAHLSIAF